MSRGRGQVEWGQEAKGVGACRRDGGVGCRGAWKQLPGALSPAPSQVLLQVLIILTGNYNFFNLLTLVLTTALLDDVHLLAESGSSRRKKMPTCECQPPPYRQPSSPPPSTRVSPAPPRQP